MLENKIWWTDQKLVRKKKEKMGFKETENSKEREGMRGSKELVEKIND